MWKLTPVASDTGITFLAAEGSPEQYTVRLRQDREKRLDLIAFGAVDAAAVDALAARLGSSGVRLVSEPGKLQTPGGLSHVVINSAQPEVTRAFYEKHLDFALSDTITHPDMGEVFWFLRCNAQHHSLAISRGPHPSGAMAEAGCSASDAGRWRAAGGAFGVAPGEVGAAELAVGDVGGVKFQLGR
jgi:catechol 2,3-dioxygenase-like lactoylglutathione lyase family enzyme